MQCLPDTIPTFEGETVTVIVDGQNRNVLNGKPLLEHAANAALIVKAVNEHAALVAVAEAAEKWQTMRLSVHTEQLRIDREHELHLVLAALASVRQ